MGVLAGTIAVVTGATRSAGRGIAVELGAAGATVYVTGRSSRGRPSAMDRPETIEETALLVDAAGGTGIAMRVDHTDPGQVDALAARIGSEQGRLDVLVNDIWGGDPLTQWGVPFWEHDLADGLWMQQLAVHTHLIASHRLVPLMLERGGLIVEVTDGITDEFRGNLYYDLAKTAVNRLAVTQAVELREHGVTVVGLTPGFLRSEAMLDHFGVTEVRWREAVAIDPHFAHSETPRFIGRAVVALAADPRIHARSGSLLATWDLADEYGFDDVDGRRPDWGAHAATLTGTAPGPPGSEPAPRSSGEDA